MPTTVMTDRFHCCLSKIINLVDAVKVAIHVCTMNNIFGESFTEFCSLFWRIFAQTRAISPITFNYIIHAPRTSNKLHIMSILRNFPIKVLIIFKYVIFSVFQNTHTYTHTIHRDVFAVPSISIGNNACLLVFVISKHKKNKIFRL